KRTDLVRDIPEHLAKGHGIERRAIGRDAQKRQVACLQGEVQAPQKGPDVIVIGGVVEDVIENTFIAAIIDRRKNAKRSVDKLIGTHIPRKISQSPVEEVGAHAPLCLFSPPPRPSFGSWQRAQTPGGLATDASWRDDRASRPQRQSV